MGGKIEISRETKIMLLKTLKNGYFELSDLETLIGYIRSEMTDDELDATIKELQKKLE